MKRYTITFIGTIMCLLLILVVPEEWPAILLYITGLWMGALSTLEINYKDVYPTIYVLKPSKKVRTNKWV